MESILEGLNKSEQFKEQFSALTSNTDRVQMCLAETTVSQAIDDYFAECKEAIETMAKDGSKNADKAASIRVQANREFTSKKFMAAFKLQQSANCKVIQLV